MNGHLTSLAGLPGRFVATSFVDGMIVTEVSDAAGNVMGSMSWVYSEPVIEPEPDGAL